jgi:hypothetical protein
MLMRIPSAAVAGLDMICETNAPADRNSANILYRFRHSGERRNLVQAKNCSRIPAFAGMTVSV